MAKARVSTNPMYTGGAGGYSFYVRDGEQVVRQRRNNSNYGESASRSEAQQSRRVRWGNLVNFYKSISSWQPKAYETKKSGQTDYNLFMSLNIGYSTIALTKDMALNGCACVAGYTVSRGSLPTIEHDLVPDEGSVGYQIKLTQAISSSTTVAQFASDVIANNPEFRVGDNLAFIIFNNIQQSDNYPYVSSVYAEVTLDTADVSLLSSKVGSNRFAKSTGNLLKLNVGAVNSAEAGCVLIHTRKIAGALQVSTQSILITSEAFWQEYTSDAWVQQCIESYGLDQTVPLDPGSGGESGGSLPSVVNVTLHGDGASGVWSSKYRMKSGLYRISPIPTMWNMSESSDSQFVLAVQTFTQDSTMVSQEAVTKEEAALAGKVDPLQIVLSDEANFLSLGMRGDTGVTIIVRVERIGD